MFVDFNIEATKFNNIRNIAPLPFLSTQLARKLDRVTRGLHRTFYLALCIGLRDLDSGEATDSAHHSQPRPSAAGTFRKAGMDTASWL